MAPIGEALERGISKSLGEESGQIFGRSFRSMDSRVFQATDVGKYTKNLLMDYKQATDQNVTKISQGITGLKASELRRHASGLARTQTFGKNDKALTTLMQYSHQTHGYTYTQNLLDSVAMVLHEDDFLEGHEHSSQLKVNAYEAFKKLPEFKKDKLTGVAPEQLKYDKTSDYHKPGAVETYVSNFIYSRFSPLIAIPHIGTALNIGLSTQLGPLSKAVIQTITNTRPNQLSQLLIESGTHAEGTMRNLRSMEAAKSGIFSRFLPGSMQDVVGKVSSNPGFGALRNWQTSLAGTASYYDAMSYAEQFAKNQSNKLVLKRLEQYGMRPHDLAQIIQNGGLSQAQLEKAVYRGVNNKIFLDTSFARAYGSQANFMARSFSMYHGYVSAQAKFMADEFKTAFAADTRSITGIAKFLATAGVVFPAVGEALKIAEMTGRGQTSQISNELEEDWQGITFQRGDSPAAKLYHFLGTYFEAHAALGSFGIAYGLIQGAQRGYIAQQIAGPMLGSAQKYLTDSIYHGAIHGSWKPAERDLLEIGLPYGVGRFLAHEYIPTKAEQKRAEQAGDFDIGRKAKKEDIDF